jgi:hypothetical protein
LKSPGGAGGACVSNDHFTITSDKKPSSRRWRDFPLQLGEGWGVRAIFEEIK